MQRIRCRINERDAKCCNREQYALYIVDVDLDSVNIPIHQDSMLPILKGSLNFKKQGGPTTCVWCSCSRPKMGQKRRLKPHDNAEGKTTS